MSQTEATRQSDYILPMLAGTDGKCAGAVIATSTGVASLDLTTVPMLPAGFANSYTAPNPNPCGHYITVQAEGADAYILFGPTQASVTGSNAPAQSTTGTKVVALAAYIPAAQERHYKIPLGDNAGAGYGNDSPCRWLGVVTKTGSGVLRVFPSSP